MRLIRYLTEAKSKINIETFYDENDSFMKKMFSYIYYDTNEFWTLNFGISTPIIVAYKGNKNNPKILGYIKFYVVDDVLKLKADVIDKVKNKVPVFSLLSKEFFKNIKKIDIKKLKSEYETPEGKKMEELVAKKLKVELIR